MEAGGPSGLHLIAEEGSDPIQELEDRALQKGGPVVWAGKPILKRARKVLYRRLRVGVEDGRVFVGKFHCLDKQGNIILYDTVEFRHIPGVAESEGKNLPPMEQRSLGLVLIPARCRTSCSVECSLDEQLDLLALDP